MEKRIRSVVPDTQQLIETWIERLDGSYTVEMRACSPLDDDLRMDFHERIDSLETPAVVVRSHVRTSLEGNEIGQTVIVAFEASDQLEAIDIIRNVTRIGRKFYRTQLERQLDRNDPGDPSWHSRDQQLSFDSDEMKAFCLLYRAAIDR